MKPFMVLRGASMRDAAITQAIDRAQREHVRVRVYHADTDEFGRRDVWFVRAVPAVGPVNGTWEYEITEAGEVIKYGTK